MFYSGIDCFMPANGETVAIAAPPVIMASISGVLLKRTMEASYSGCVLAISSRLLFDERV